MKIKLISKKILLFTSVVVLVIFTVGVAAQEEEHVSVIVNAPEFVSGTFDATIDIYDVIDLASGNFDLYFDPNVVNVNDVYAGEIDDTTMPIAMWHLVDVDRVRVLVKLPDAGLVSGSGSLAAIKFEVVGNDGDTSALEVSDGANGGLFSYITYGGALQGYEDNTGDKEINADWSGDVVTVGNVGTVTTASTPVQTATPRPSASLLDSGAGSATASTPGAEHASDAAVPVGTSERDEQDAWEVLVEHNFIGTYLFIGLLAFAYTLISLR